MSNKPDRSHTKSEPVDLPKVQEAVRKRAISEFGQPAIADGLVNRVSLRLLEQSREDQAPLCWDKLYRREVEAWFSELQSHCRRYAAKLVHDPETAADICQDCLKELLLSQNSIHNVKAWICRVAHNKAVSQINKEMNERNLAQELKNIPVPEDPEDAELPARLDRKQLRKLLSRADYSLWLRLCAHKTLKDYARAEGISYQTAKARKHRIRTNLRSAWLRARGWTDSPQVLSHDEFRAIQRFITRLLASYGSDSPPARPEQRNKLRNPILQEAFRGVSKIHEWTVSLLDEGGFSLLVVGIRDELPLPVKLLVRLDRAHRVRVIDCRSFTMMAFAPSDGARIFTAEKGRNILKYEELLRLVPKCTVLDKERFDRMLADLKLQDHD